MRMLLLFAVLLSFCGCAALADMIDDKFPDGESCLSLETPRKTVSICISKTTVIKAEIDPPQALSPGQDCLEPFCYTLQATESLPPLPVIPETSTLERLIANVGFPIVVCLILIYMQWKFLACIKEAMTNVSGKLDKLINFMAAKES